MSSLLESYNPAWSVEFSELSSVYAGALGPLALRIEHIGSTAVPGLSAKPILDIDIVICPEQSPELQRHLCFRDALRTSSSLRNEYEMIKREIDSGSGGDRKIYARLKEDACRDFVERAINA